MSAELKAVECPVAEFTVSNSPVAEFTKSDNPVVQVPVASKVYPDVNPGLQLREMNKYSYQRKLEAAGYPDGLPELYQDVPFDIDMVRIVGLPVRFLPNLCYGICDLAGRQPLIKDFLKRNLDMGRCIVSNPILIYIPHNKKQEFAEQLQLHVNERFLAVSTVLDPNRFLTSRPRKIHLGPVSDLVFLL